MKTCKICGCFSHGYETCGECLDIVKPESLDHSYIIRCPKCGVPTEAISYEADDIFFDGNHKIDCLECLSTFTFETSVSYTFTSPEMEKK